MELIYSQAEFLPHNMHERQKIPAHLRVQVTSGKLSLKKIPFICFIYKLRIWDHWWFQVVFLKRQTKQAKFILQHICTTVIITKDRLAFLGFTNTSQHFNATIDRTRINNFLELIHLFVRLQCCEESQYNCL